MNKAAFTAEEVVAEAAFTATEAVAEVVAEAASIVDEVAACGKSAAATASTAALPRRPTSVRRAGLDRCGPRPALRAERKETGCRPTGLFCVLAKRRKMFAGNSQLLLSSSI